VNPLTALYGAIVRKRNEMYDRGALQTMRLQGPVVSIGNLTVGGSGKTPFLMTLGQLLKQRGVTFDVLSRGYRRATKGVALVDANGSPRDFGDEPLLIAHKLGVPVIVGEDRYAAGQFAEQKFGPQLHLLDDGFQHRRLARDFDIVLLTDRDATDSLLPIGRLREPLSALSRSNAIVLTNDTDLDGLPLPNQQVWRVHRGVTGSVVKESCFAFCGIARPDSFFADLASAGITLTGTMSFPDHHTYTNNDIRRLLALRQRHNATSFLTTEKDAINLGDFLPQLKPLEVVAVQMELLDADDAINTLLDAITRRNTLLHETI
jgi:tetraacyldisaccharide 4'-kinase